MLSTQSQDVGLPPREDALDGPWLREEGKWRQARGREGGYEAKKLAVGSHGRVTFADILICRDMGRIMSKASLEIG